MLIELLKRSPALHSLVLQNEYEYRRPSKIDKSLMIKLQVNRDYADSDLPWNPPEFVPICLTSHIKAISMRAFRGNPDDQIEVPKYLLENGQVLQNMTIYTAGQSLFSFKLELKPKLARLWIKLEP
ncbi:hypothetical protein EV1_030739 [Malus domestica]